MDRRKPIGIFDSGVGGTSIWKEIHALLPNEDIVYLADSKNAPYGNRPTEEIIELSIKNTEKLIEFGCKIIVVACNTATTNAISTLRKTFSLPFIGIEPAIKPAALKSKSHAIGILATKGTLNSQLFCKTSKEFAKHTNLIEIIGEGLVPLIESGDTGSDEILSLLKEYTKPMIDANVDYIVLGCTHYPYLIPSLKKILPAGIKIIDSGEAVARQTKVVLENLGLLEQEQRQPNLRFYSNTKTSTLEFLLSDYKEEISIDSLDF